jgi:hypothetical protein
MTDFPRFLTIASISAVSGNDSFAAILFDGLKENKRRFRSRAAVQRSPPRKPCA